MQTDLFRELSDAELDLLDEFLLNRLSDDIDTEDKDEGIFDISTLDGYLTAIVSGPVTVPPSQWLPGIWGEYEPVWEDPQAFEQIFSLIMRHMNTIAYAIIQHPAEFEPLYYEREVEGQCYTVVDEWCEGYIRGTMLTPESWAEGGEEVTAFLNSIAAFTGYTEWLAHDRPSSETVKLQQEVAVAARELHAFWHARRGESVVVPSRPQTAVRQTPRTGRNEPCPCGSGKKYRKCCLH